MNLKTVIAVVVLILCLLTAFTLSKMTGNIIKTGTQVKLETNYGDIVIQLYPEKAPITVANFKNYTNEGFYDNTIFHRVINGFMIQGGGFTTGGEEKQTNEPIKLESKNGLENNRGTVAMARTPLSDSATSQFFINLKDNDFLNYGNRDDGYAVFGKVIKGMDVVDKIANVSVSNEMPLKEVIIIKATVIK